MESVIENEDLWTQVLSRLPTSSLVRLKNVRRKWNSIASSPSFARNHSVLSPPSASPTTGLFLRRTSSDEYIHHFVSYPAGTESVFKVPSLTLDRTESVFKMSLGFEPTTSEVNLICATLRAPPGSALSCRFYLFSSSTGSWTNTSPPSLPMPFKLSATRAIYWNDSFHWLNRTSTFEMLVRRRNRIFAYDLRTKACRFFWDLQSDDIFSAFPYSPVLDGFGFRVAPEAESTEGTSDAVEEDHAKLCLSGAVTFGIFVAGFRLGLFVASDMLLDQTKMEISWITCTGCY